MFVNGIQAGRKRAFFFSCGHLPIISESLGKIQIFSMFTLFFFFFQSLLLLSSRGETKKF